MSRAPYLPSVPFGWYYVSRTAVDNRRIIVNPAELGIFRELLAIILAEHGMRLYFAYLYETEMQLAFFAREEGLDEILGIFCQRFAYWINRECRETGALFWPHAKMRLVETGSWLLAVGCSIHGTLELRSKGTESSDLHWNTDTFCRDRKRVCGVAASTIFRSVARASRNTQVQEQAYRVVFDQRPPVEEIELIRPVSPQDRRVIRDSAFIAQVENRQGLVLQPRLPYNRSTQEDIQAGVERMVETFHRTNCLVAKGAKPEQAEDFFDCRPSTLSSERRSRYRLHFEEVFGRGCEQLFQAPKERECLTDARLRVRKIAHQSRRHIDAREGLLPRSHPPLINRKHYAALRRFVSSECPPSKEILERQAITD
jgi:hypothetical protein